MPRHLGSRGCKRQDRQTTCLEYVSSKLPPEYASLGLQRNCEMLPQCASMSYGRNMKNISNDGNDGRFTWLVPFEAVFILCTRRFFQRDLQINAMKHLQIFSHWQIVRCYLIFSEQLSATSVIPETSWCFLRGMPLVLCEMNVEKNAENIR